MQLDIVVAQGSLEYQERESTGKKNYAVIVNNTSHSVRDCVARIQVNENFVLPDIQIDIGEGVVAHDDLWAG